VCDKVCVRKRVCDKELLSCANVHRRRCCPGLSMSQYTLEKGLFQAPMEPFLLEFNFFLFSRGNYALGLLYRSLRACLSLLPIRKNVTSTLQCVKVCYSMLQCVAICHSVLRCVAVRRCKVQCVTVCCLVPSYTNALLYVAVCCSVLQCVAVCCSVLQCVAVCCSVLQCVAV